MTKVDEMQYTENPFNQLNDTQVTKTQVKMTK